MLSLLPWSILPPVATTTFAGKVALGRQGAWPRTLQSGGNCWTMYCTGVEIEVASLDAALQSHRGLRAIGGDDAAVIANAIVYRQVASHLPAVLHIGAADTARPLREKNVALVLRVGIVEQEIGQTET